MRDWLETCSQAHPSCKGNTEDEFLPARLVYLGQNLEDPEPPRLVVTREAIAQSPEQSFAYVALSYCWGTALGKTVPKTTKSTLASHTQGLDLKTLPKTFRDAMEVSRRLKCHYIWIDSLCIIQDDTDDFERECSDMHRIYSSAYCTISVSRLTKTLYCLMLKTINRLQMQLMGTKAAFYLETLLYQTCASSV